MSLVAVVVAAVTCCQSPPLAAQGVSMVYQRGHSHSMEGGWQSLYDEVRSFDISPNGRWLLSAGGQKAILWDRESGLKLREFVGHTNTVSGAVFLSDTRIVTSSYDQRAILWDATTGRQLRTIFDEGDVHGVDFHPIAGLLLHSHGFAVLFAVDTWKEVARFPHPSKVGFATSGIAAKFSANGKMVVTSGPLQRLRIWRVDGELLHTLQLRNDDPKFIRNSRGFFSSDGKHILAVGGFETTVIEAASGKRVDGQVTKISSFSAVGIHPTRKEAIVATDSTLQRLELPTGRLISEFGEAILSTEKGVSAISIDRTGSRLSVGTDDGTVLVWDLDLNKLHQRFPARARNVVESLAISPDGSLLLLGTSPATIWDLQTGQIRYRLNVSELEIGSTDPSDAKLDPGYRVGSTEFSPDGRVFVTGHSLAAFKRGSAVWDTTTGELRCPMAWRAPSEGGIPVSVATYDSEGKRIAIGVHRGVQLRDAISGDLLTTFEIHPDGEISSVVFTPDDNLLVAGLTSSNDNQQNGVAILNSDTGKLVNKLHLGGQSWVQEVDVSPDGSKVVAVSRNSNAVLFDINTGQELRRFQSPNQGCAVAFSPSGGQVLVGYQGKAILWDSSSGVQLQVFEAPSDKITAVAFHPDRPLAFTGSYEGTVFVWNVENGERVCQLDSFQDGTWAVIDSEGRYDASNLGVVDGFHWVVDNEPVSLAQLKERYYEPGLLAKVTGFNKESVRAVRRFRDPKLYPKVSVTQPRADDPTLKIELKRRDGGFGKVVVTINGKEATSDARSLPENAHFDGSEDNPTLAVDLSNDPRLKLGEDNLIEVHAFNEEGYLRSRNVETIYRPRGIRRGDAPNVWAVVAGVSDYRGNAIDLRFAAKDAEDFAQALDVSAGRLFTPEKLQITLLSTEQHAADRQPTRDNLINALQALRIAKPTDILVIYLSGHGINFGGEKGDYYFLTSDASSADLGDSSVRNATAISSRQLTEMVLQIPALKQVMILDTCASGAAIEKLTEQRTVPASTIRALERVNARTGTFILAGCASSSVSYEATPYAQGLLTHSLLLGIRGASLRDAQFVDVQGLFSFATDQVPKLAQGVGGIQQPVVATPPGGASFDIGQVDNEDKRLIPLQPARPLLLRTTLLDEIEFDDVLNLSELVDQQLRDLSAGGRTAPVVFIDVRRFPGAIRLAGRYRIDGDKVTVIANLFRGQKRVGGVSVTGTRTEIETLTEKLVTALVEKLANF